MKCFLFAVSNILNPGKTTIKCIETRIRVGVVETFESVF